MLLLLGVHLGLTIVIDGPLVAASILAAEVEGHEASEKEGHGDCGGECDMSRNKSIRNQQQVSKLMVLKNVPWRVFRQEAVSRNGTTQVAETDVHGDTDTTLETATDVVAVPCNTHGYQWVDTRSSEEGTGVLDAGLTGTGKHGESDNGGGLVSEHEDTTLLRTVGKESSADGEDTSHNVWGDGHELTDFIGVSHILDNTMEDINNTSEIISAE